MEDLRLVIPMPVRRLTPETSQSQRMRRKAATFARHRLRVLELLSGKPDGETVRHFRDTLKLTTSKVRFVLRSLLDDGLIVPSRFDKHERRESGYRIWGPTDNKTFIPGGTGLRVLI
jgi:hypothetical protein